MGMIVGIQSSAISSYTLMLSKAIPKPAAAITAGRRLQLYREKHSNLSFPVVARPRLMVNGQYPVPQEVPGTGTPPEFPRKRTGYPTPPIPPEVPGLPTGPEIEINPGRELTTQPPDIPEVPNPFPGKGPEMPVPPIPSPPDVPFPQPPDQVPPRVPPDPDILPPSTPPDIPPPDIKPPPGPAIF